MKNMLSFFGFQAALVLLGWGLWTFTGCRQLYYTDDAKFFAQLSNSHIAGCNAVAVGVSGIDGEHRLRTWSVRCHDGRRFACSMARGVRQKTTCSLQSAPPKE